LAPLAQITADYRMDQYVEVVRQDHVWDTNWKLLTENFMEGYHLPVTHRKTVGAYFPAEETEFSDTPHEAFAYQLFQKTEDAPIGTAHPDNKVLQGRWRTTSVMPTVFPSHMYVLAPDHLWYLSLQPAAIDKVSIRYGVAFAPEKLAAANDRDAMVEQASDFLWKVNLEDRFVVEGLFAGTAAPLAEPGPLSWLERENHEFAGYVARRLTA
jgi:phenylpropionate dioxygenase-like ring-hydroxylating dioxygenase large terminal subunit